MHFGTYKRKAIQNNLKGSKITILYGTVILIVDIGSSLMKRLHNTSFHKSGKYFCFKK